MRGPGTKIGSVPPWRSGIVLHAFSPTWLIWSLAFEKGLREREPPDLDLIRGGVARSFAEAGTSSLALSSTGLWLLEAKASMSGSGDDMACMPSVVSGLGQCGAVWATLLGPIALGRVQHLSHVRLYALKSPAPPM